ncbi:MAG: hypothetical protein AAGL68_09940 [Pseudomonadota bacterium]
MKSRASFGLPMWIQTRCRQVFFMSDRLVKAIKAEGLTGFYSAKCQVA